VADQLDCSACRSTGVTSEVMIVEGDGRSLRRGRTTVTDAFSEDMSYLITLVRVDCELDS